MEEEEIRRRDSFWRAGDQLRQIKNDLIDISNDLTDIKNISNEAIMIDYKTVGWNNYISSKDELTNARNSLSTAISIADNNC